MLRRLKNLLRPLLRTPLHPQWLSRNGNAGLMAWLRQIPPDSRVLDVGCADQWPRGVMPSVRYVGIDLPGTSTWYGTRPDVYADAQAMPVRAESIDVALLLDVLEHLPDPSRALDQVHGALKPGGRLILQVPFLYPLHDVPHDYTRWTEHGLRALAGRSGFSIERATYAGEPLITAALLLNIALVHSIVQAFERKNPTALLAPLVPVVVLAVNLAAVLAGWLFGRSAFMPYAYQGVWTKPAGAAGH
ncbi:MAG: class I SAM-dependent methyltransferase [Nevskiaceae bacterium]